MNLAEYKDKLKEMAELASKNSEACYEMGDDTLAQGWWMISKAVDNVQDRIVAEVWA